MLIKKNLKRLISFYMTVTLVVSTIISTSVFINAAAKPKLSNRKVTVTIGKKKKLTVKGVRSKKIKKTTWSVKNRKTASLSKKKKTGVTIKGIKKGNTKVIAKVKVGKRTYTLKCNVKVNPKPTIPETKKPTATARVATQQPLPTKLSATTEPPLPTEPPVSPTDTPTPATDTPVPSTDTPATDTPAPATEKPTPDPRTTVVDFEDDEIGTTYAYTEGDSAPTVRIAADPVNAGGKSLQITNGGYNQAAIVPINLPNALHNYESISFNFSLVGGSSLSYKNLLIYVADNTSVFKKWGFGNSSTEANQFAANLLGATSQTSFTDEHKNKWTNYKITITNPGDNIKDLNGNLFLAIGMNHNDIDFMIDDLTFRLKDVIAESPAPTPLSPTPRSLNISNSLLTLSEDFNNNQSPHIQSDGPISGVTKGNEIARSSIATNPGLSAANGGRPQTLGGSSGRGIRFNTYSAEDYVQLAVKNDKSENKTYLFSFCLKYASYEDSTVPADMPIIPLQIVKINTDNPNKKTVLKNQNIEFSYTHTSTNSYYGWYDFIISFEVPANQTVYLQINQTSSITNVDGTSESYVQLLLDNFNLWSVASENNLLTIAPQSTSSLEVDLAEGESVTWSSNDTSIATVDEKGEVTANVTGQTWVIAEIKDTGGTVLRKNICMIDVSYENETSPTTMPPES